MPAPSLPPLAVIVPSYRPDERLPERLASFRASGFRSVVVVDDGFGVFFHHLLIVPAIIQYLKVIIRLEGVTGSVIYSNNVRHITCIFETTKLYFVVSLLVHFYNSVVSLFPAPAIFVHFQGYLHI